MPGVQFPSATPRLISDKFGERPSLMDYNAVADAVELTDAAISIGDQTLTSAAAPFVAGDVGKVVCIAGAGSVGAALVTTIASFTSTSSVELTDAASATVSGAGGVFGTDNAAAIADFIADIVAVGRKGFITAGWYLTTADVDITESLELEGDARDNAASSVIVYVGTGSGIYIRPTDLGQQIFAVNVKNIAIVSYRSADALKARNLSQAIFENIGVGQAAGSLSTAGINLINPNILTFRGTIVQDCTTAVVIDSTGFPWDATSVAFEGGNLYRNQTVFDVRANTVHWTVRNLHIEDYETAFLFDKVNTNLQVERAVIEDNEILGGGTTYPDSTLISGLAPGITTLLMRRIEFSRNRCYFITAKENPFNFNITGTADIQLRLTDNVFSNITTSLISANSSAIEVVAEGNLRRFGSAFDLLSAGSTAVLYVPVYGGQRIASAGLIPYSRGAGELEASPKLLFASDKVTVSTDPADAQIEISDSAYSRVLRWFVGTSGYTAIAKFAGALGALAINGLTTLGSDEAPPCTVFIHDNGTGGHTQLQVKGNAADGALNAILNILTSASAAALQVLGNGVVLFPQLTASRNARIGSGGDLTTGQVNLTDSNDVSVGGMTDGALVKVSSGVLASATAFTATRMVVTDGSGNLVAHTAQTASRPMATASDGLPTTTSYTDIYNNIKADIAADFISLTDLTTYYYSKSEVDTLLAAKTDDTVYSAHTHTIGDHTHGGVTTGGDSTASGGSGSTSGP